MARNPDAESRLPYLVWLPIEGGLVLKARETWPRAREYPDLFRTQPGRGSWLADMLARLAVRYPEVPIIFAGSRKFAEEWTYRFFGAAAGDSGMTGQDIPARPPDGS